MTSYRSQAVRPTRSPLSARIPQERRQHWTELPGWVTTYVREKTEVQKKDAQNAHVFDLLCKLWGVTKTFGTASGSDEEDNRQVFIITEALTTREANRPTQDASKDISHIIYFLARNTGSDTKRLARLDPNLHCAFTHSTPQDWIVLPVPDMIHWLYDRVPKTTEKALRHIPKSIPCQVAVFGDLINHSSHLSAACMKFSQVWHRGIFLTITSSAAASQPDNLKELISNLIKRQYENHENSGESYDPKQLVLWLSLHTYWLLSPPSIREGRTPQNISIPLIRAFNQILNPDYPLPILNKDQVDCGIKNILEEVSAVHLMESEEIIAKLKIPGVELKHHVTAMSNVYHDRSDENGDEVNSIIEIGIKLIRTFWLFRVNLVVVDEVEMNHLHQNQLPWVYEE